jgi:hypothetical protein
LLPETRLFFVLFVDALVANNVQTMLAATHVQFQRECNFSAKYVNIPAMANPKRSVAAMRDLFHV